MEGEYLYWRYAFAGPSGERICRSSYRSLIESVQEKIFTLPGDRIIYPGHGPETTLAEEKASNPFHLSKRSMQIDFPAGID